MVGSSGTGGFFVDALIQARDFTHPTSSVRVLERENALLVPMEVVSDEGYLLEDRVEGVASNPPRPPTSAWNSCSHFGQLTVNRSGSSALIRL